APEQPRGAQRQQVRIARARADEIDGAGVAHGQENGRAPAEPPARMRIAADRRALAALLDPLRNRRDKLLELLVVAQVEVALRERDFDPVFLEQVPQSLEHFGANVADAFL